MQERERPKPRVVDKRISARAQEKSTVPPANEPASVAPPPPPPAEAPPEPAPSVDDDPAAAVRDALMQDLIRVPASDWVVNSILTMLNVADVKLSQGQLPEAGLAIDAATGSLDRVGSRIGEAEAPLRQALAQIQMAYAERAGSGSTSDST